MRKYLLTAFDETNPFFTIINYIVGRVADGQLIIDLVQKYIAEPFLGLSQGLGAVLIVTVFVQVFWFFGIHGANVLAPVLEGIWGQAQLINIDIFQKVITEKLVHQPC
ncbi:hypothetical protein EfmJHP36_11290 [Enterococcus faecium]|nr:hypothetical protein EfmJHP36_11290 [Enterococcus faecium]